jgi:hypothetical protein
VHQDPPAFAWAFEIVGPCIWLIMAVHFWRKSRRLGAITVPALLFIGATTQSWQEWYADWGGYVLYNPHLHLMTWWHGAYTSPNKPWAVIPAYGWFFGAIYFPLISLLHKVHAFLGRRAWMKLPTFSVFLLFAGFGAHYLWDLLIEGSAVLLGMWNYTTVIGPSLSNHRGHFPLVYPIIPFALLMSVTMLIIDAKRPDGTPMVEHWARVDRFTGTKHHVARIVTWILTMNLTYLLLFTIPICLFRGTFLPFDPRL